MDGRLRQRYIYDIVAYALRLQEYPTVSDINELCEIAMTTNVM